MFRKYCWAASIFAICSAALLSVGNHAHAQRGGGGGMLGSSSMGLLGDQKVSEELELGEDQVESIKSLQDEMRGIFRDSFGGMRDKFREPNVDREALMAEIREKIATQMSTVDEKLEDILLPHQMTRLQELTFQMETKRGGTTGLLNNAKVKEKLGLTDEQIEKIKAKAEEVKAQLEEKIAKAREDAQEEILSVLTPEQQAQIKEMVGDSFEFEERRGWGGGGGDRGGRGGDRGGRGGGDRGGRGGDRGDRGGRGGGGERGAPQGDGR